MIFRKARVIGAALLLTLASLFTFGFSENGHALGNNLYWCEFSSNSSFNIATNWNTASDCSSGTNRVPANADNLIFDNSAINSPLNITNNISNLDLNSIVFQGSGNAGYSLSGNNISLDNGVSDSGSGAISNTILLNMSLTGDQAFNNGLSNDTLNFAGSVALGAHNLLVTGNSTRTLTLAGLTGSGNLTFNGPPSGSVASYRDSSSNPSFSGPLVINSGAAVQDQSGTLNGYGSGQITVNSGGSYYIFSSSLAATLTNSLVLSGSGDGVTNFGALISCLGPSSCTSSNSVLTLSGDLTLNGNTKVVNGAYSSGGPVPTSSATFDFTGNYFPNAFSLTALANSNTIVNLPPPSGSSSGSGSSSSSSSTSSGSSSNLKAPNTGIAATGASYLKPLIGSSFLALSLILTAPLLVNKLFHKNRDAKK